MRHGPHGTDTPDSTDRDGPSATRNDSPMSTCGRNRRDGRPCTQPSATGDCGRHTGGGVAVATRPVSVTTTDPFATMAVSHDRAAAKEAAQAERERLGAALAERITAEGGQVHVDIYDDDLARLVADGAFMDGRQVRFMPGAASQCHRNTADLHDAGIARIATGYAQSGNGGWVQHSWGIDPADGAIIETTVARSRYFGIVLTDDEAGEFVFMNG